MEGETAVLACAGYGEPSSDITWTRNGVEVSPNITVTQDDVVFGTRAFSRSLLQLCSVEMEDSGAYTCVVGNGNVSVSRTVQLTVTG